MSKATRATQTLEKAGITFTVHSYDYNPDAERVGLQAAEALGESPERVLKTSDGGGRGQTGLRNCSFRP